MQYHKCTISMKIGFSRGNDRSIIDFRINTSIGLLGTKLKNVLGLILRSPLAHENLRRNSMFCVKIVEAQGA